MNYDLLALIILAVLVFSGTIFFVTFGLLYLFVGMVWLYDRFIRWWIDRGNKW